MAFKDWESFSDDRIKLPIGGNVYELPEVSARLGHLLRLAQAGKKVPELKDLTPEKEADLFLGVGLHKRMVDDDVPDAAIARAVVVVITDWQLGRDAAEAVWEAGIDPERLAAGLAAKAQQRTESTSTGEATTTPRPASTSGMSTPTTTRRAKPRGKSPVKAAASPGSTSPSNGD